MARIGTAKMNIDEIAKPCDSRPSLFRVPTPIMPPCFFCPQITNFCLEKKNQPFSFRLKQSLLRFHIPNRKNFLRSTKPMKTKIYKPNWGYWRVSLSSVLSSFSPYCILQRNKALSSLPYCVSQHNKENFQRDTPITSSNCPRRGYTMLNRE